MRILKGYAQQVTLVFDSDEAGVKAAQRTLPLFVQEKVDARVMRLPEGKDPDSCVQETGGEQFRQMAGQALGMIEFLIASVIEKHGLSPQGKVRTVEALRGPLGSLTDGVSRSVYVKYLADRLDIDESAILQQIRTSTPAERKREFSPKPRKNGSKLEETVVAIMLQRPDLLPSFNAQEIVESLETPALRTVGQMILEKLEASRIFAGADLISESQGSEIRKVITSLSMSDKSWDQESCTKIIRQYQAYLRKKEERALLRRIKEAEKAHDEKLLSDLLAEKQRRVHQRLNPLGG
jgi:DNA primase